MRRRENSAGLSEVFVEFQQNGSYTKAIAIDPVSMVEVSIVGATASPRHILQQAAVRKLEYVLKNKRGSAAPGRGLLAWRSLPADSGCRCCIHHSACLHPRPDLSPPIGGRQGVRESSPAFTVSRLYRFPLASTGQMSTSTSPRHT